MARYTRLWKSRILLLLTVTLGVSFAAGANPLDFLKKLPFIGKKFNEQTFYKAFNASFSGAGKLPTTVQVDGQIYTPEYSIRPELEESILEVWRRHRSDFTSVVVMDNNNGRILAAIDMARESTTPGRLATFAPTHPAASVFKIITAADLLENTHVGKETEFKFAGRSTTLYKHQLKQNPNGRWGRRTDFEEAFARSNNVIFARAALENLSPNGLKRMAEKFGFNRPMLPFLQAGPSVFPLAIDQFNLAELASGFNVRTLISPVHGALIASTIANGGVRTSPSVITRVRDSEGNVVWESTPTQELVITADTAGDLRRMMRATVLEGTARRPFRRPSRAIENLEIAGKTGSITGGEPYGKHDWFVAYVRDPKRPEDKGISICVMIVNKRRWYVKSTQFTREILELIWGASRTSAQLRRTIWNRT